MEIYKITVIDANGEILDKIITDLKPLAKDFEEVIKATRTAQNEKTIYTMERQHDNPYNDDISITGYIDEGVYLPNGYPLRKHYQTRIKNGKKDWTEKIKKELNRA